jgi:hypothetical protein
VNGIAFVPSGAAGQLIFDTKGRRVRTIGGEFALWVRNSLLKRGSVDWDLTPAGGVVGAAFGAGSGANFGKLPAEGDIRVRFQQLLGRFQALITGAAGTPFFGDLQRGCGAKCPAVTADIKMTTDNKEGLKSGGLGMLVRNVLLDRLLVRTFEATYDPATDRWHGVGSLTVPTPNPITARLDWVTEASRLVSAEGSVANLPVGIGITLKRFELALHRDPVELSGLGELTAGPVIGGRPAIAINGNFLYRLAGRGPGLDVFHAEGSTQILSFLSSGHVNLWGSGAFDFGIRVEIGFPVGPGDPRRKPVFVGASLDGWLSRTNFGAEGVAELIVLGVRAARAEMVLSNVGWAACGQLGWLRGGAAQRWSERDPSIMGGSCDVAVYRARKTAHAAQGGPMTLRLRDSSRGTVLRFRGNGGPPRVILEGPGGQRVAASTDGSPVVNRGFVVLQDADSSATHVAIRRPGGRWRVTVAEGSPPVTGVDSADVLEPPSVTARVRGRGSKRTLSWRLRRVPGQRVIFAETGRDSARVITKTTAARGSVRFTPADGNGRARKIVAMVQQAGAPRATLTVARYTAPPWRKPARPSRLRVRRKGSNLLVSWRRASGAARYMVFVKAADGERELFVVPARKRRLRVRGVKKTDRALVRVAGLRSDNAAGALATRRVKPVRRR